jgi:MinD-like ATPase involved in chromosome partitioning or flagellar assembly
MPAMKLILLDEDIEFSDMLAVFLRTTAFGEQFSLQSFTSKEAGLQYMASDQARGIFMVHEALLPLPDSVFHRERGSVFILSESQGATGMEEVPVLCKYQPLDQLLSSVKTRITANSQEGPLTGTKDGQVIGIYSAVAGAGKTVVTAHLARQLAQQGERVFCLTLELQPSNAWYPARSAEEDAFAELLYYVKAQPQQAPAKLEQVKQRHAWGRYDYLPAAASQKEMRELSALDVAQLLKSLKELRSYDRILLELDSELHASSLAGLKECDRLLWLLLDEQIHLHKALSRRQWLEQEESLVLMDKTWYVRNKSIGRAVNDFPAMGFSLAGELPYLPEWKCYARVDQLSSSTFVEPLLKQLVGRKEARDALHVEH